MLKKSLHVWVCTKCKVTTTLGFLKLFSLIILRNMKISVTAKDSLSSNLSQENKPDDGFQLHQRER